MKNILIAFFLIFYLGPLNNYRQKKSQLYMDFKDSIFSNYEKRAQIYITKRYCNSPIKPYMLALAARNAYDSTGILVPVEFSLAQAQLESSMGTKGRSSITNPFNIGEYDNKTAIKFDSTFEGIQAYYYFVTTTYLKCKSIDQLLENYTNCNGHRYASKSTYEEILKKQYDYIVCFIDKKIQETNSCDVY